MSAHTKPQLLFINMENQIYHEFKSQISHIISKRKWTSPINQLPSNDILLLLPSKNLITSTPFPTLASQIGRQTQLRSMVIYSMGTRFCQTSSQCGRIGRFLWNKIIMSSAHQIADNLKITRVFISLFSWIMLLTQYLSRPS